MSALRGERTPGCVHSKMFSRLSGFGEVLNSLLILKKWDLLDRSENFFSESK